MTEVVTEVKAVKEPNHSEPFKEWPAAFAKFQAEVQNPKMSADNPHLKSKYAPLAEVLNTVRPILAKHGFSVMQNVSTRGDNAVVITTLFHSSGEWYKTDPLLIPATRGGKPMDAQGIGSAISYGKRYQLQAAVGVAADADSDGEDLSSHAPLHVPHNLVNNPTLAGLKAKWQLGMKDLNGFEDWYRKMKDEGRDDLYIDQALDKAIAKKKQLPEPAA